MEYEKQNHYVGDGNILLYTDEYYIVKKLMKLCIRILSLIQAIRLLIKSQ